MQELKTTRNNMSADRWAEWVSFAKTEKAKRAATDRDKLISQMHQKEYKEGLIGFSGPSSRDASPSRWSSSKLKPSANVTLLSGVSALDSLQRQPVRPLFNGTSGVPSNQLQVCKTAYLMQSRLLIFYYV